MAQSVQRLATGWKVRGSNPSRGRDFPHLSRPAPRPTQHPVQWVPGLSQGKGGRGVVLTTHPHLVSPGSRKRVQLYLYAACNRMERHFTFTFISAVCYEIKNIYTVRDKTTGTQIMSRKTDRQNITRFNWIINIYSSRIIIHLLPSLRMSGATTAYTQPYTIFVQPNLY